MGLPDQTLNALRPLSEAEMVEWEDAYHAVESYLSSLRVRNRLLSAELVRGILWRASERTAIDPGMSARELAIEETLFAIGDWTEQVLGEPLEGRRLAVRGRLALLLAGMPDKWQPIFLTAPPWPSEFVEAMRSSYLAAGPQFAELKMVPQELEFNAIGSGAAQWYETMDRQPIIRWMSVVLILVLIIGGVWFIFLADV